jgi:competence protein ComEA
MNRRALLALLPVLAALPPCNAGDALLELNTASRAELESLPGIGPDLAARLLAARAQAPFADWAELRRRVQGIGEASARRLSAHGLRIQGQAYNPSAPAIGASAPTASSQRH